LAYIDFFSCQTSKPAIFQFSMMCNISLVLWEIHTTCFLIVFWQVTYPCAYEILLLKLFEQSFVSFSDCGLWNFFVFVHLVSGGTMWTAWSLYILSSPALSNRQTEMVYSCSWSVFPHSDQAWFQWVMLPLGHWWTAVAVVWS
jgi:hypothetical protein